MTPATKSAPKSKSTSKAATIRKKGTDASAEHLRRTLSRQVKATIAADERAEDAASTSPTTATTPASETSEPKQAAKGSRTKMDKLDKSPTPKSLGGLDAAALVLKTANGPLTCKEVWAAIDAKKLWFTEGKTPEATIYSAILREIAAKGKESRFRKASRGKFELAQ